MGFNPDWGVEYYPRLRSSSMRAPVTRGLEWHEVSSDKRVPVTWGYRDMRAPVTWGPQWHEGSSDCWNAYAVCWGWLLGIQWVVSCVNFLNVILSTKYSCHVCSIAIWGSTDFETASWLTSYPWLMSHNDVLADTSQYWLAVQTVASSIAQSLAALHYVDSLCRASNIIQPN